MSSKLLSCWCIPSHHHQRSGALSSEYVTFETYSDNDIVICFVSIFFWQFFQQVISTHTRTMPLCLTEVKTHLTRSYLGKDKGVEKQNNSFSFLLCNQQSLRSKSYLKISCKWQVRQCARKGREVSSVLDASTIGQGKKCKPVILWPRKELGECRKLQRLHYFMGKSRGDRREEEEGIGSGSTGVVQKKTWEVSEPLQIELEWKLSWWGDYQGSMEAEHLSTEKKVSLSLGVCKKI